MKKKFLTVISVILLFAFSFLIVNVGAYAYWGRRHKVLYDVDTVYVTQSEENSDIYYLTYKVRVKNWWFDAQTHTYMLKDALGGEPGGWHFEAETEYFTSTNKKNTCFDLVVEFDSSTYNGGSSDPVSDAVSISEFRAYDIDGDKVDSASLFMNDFPNVDIVFNVDVDFGKSEFYTDEELQKALGVVKK